MGKRIILGVTTEQSLILLKGFPEFLVNRGWEVHLVSGPGPRLDALSIVDGVFVHPLAMEREPSPLKDVRALWQWIRTLRKVRPDVVTIGTPKAGLLGLIAAAVVRVPHRIYHLRGLRLETVGGWAGKLLKALEQATAASSHVVLAVSPSLAIEAAKIRLAREDKITVLGSGSSNGVDLEHFRSSRFSDEAVQRERSRLKLKEDVPTIGFVGRLVRDKGIHVLKEALVILAERGIRHQLLIVGAGFDESEHVESLPKETGGAPIIVGQVADTAIYYQMMDVFCLPTLREGFPNVVLEAAASGVPTVTTDATGAVDSVVDGRTGLICRLNSASDLADKLGQLLGSRSKRVAMGKSARLHVEENFRRETLMDATEVFYGSRLSHAVP